jgi:Ca-activated chloride channel family protein
VKVWDGSWRHEPGRGKDSEYIKKFNYDDVAQLAESARGMDKEGYRVEFINMVKSFGLIASK